MVSFTIHSQYIKKWPTSNIKQVKSFERSVDHASTSVTEVRMSDQILRPNRICLKLTYAYDQHVGRLLRSGSLL